MKTVIVLGNARSGTSMIGGFIHHFGIDMNPKDNPSPQNPKGSFEDHDMLDAINDIYHAKETGEGMDEAQVFFRDLVERRNAKGVDWGFKSGLTHWVWDQLDLSLFENIHLVFNYRNIMSNAKSWIIHMRDNYGAEVSFEDALVRTTEGYCELSGLINRCKSFPRLYTSYEQVKAAPVCVAEKLADFLGVERCDPEVIESFIMKGYSTLES